MYIIRDNSNIWTFIILKLLSSFLWNVALGAYNLCRCFSHETFLFSQFEAEIVSYFIFPVTFIQRILFLKATKEQL